MEWNGMEWTSSELARQVLSRVGMWHGAAWRHDSPGHTQLQFSNPEAEIGYAAWLSARNAVHCHSDHSQLQSTASSALLAALLLPLEVELRDSHYHSAWHLTVQQPPPPWLMLWMPHTDRFLQGSLCIKVHRGQRAPPPLFDDGTTRPLGQHHRGGISVPLFCIICFAATTLCILALPTRSASDAFQHLEPQSRPPSHQLHQRPSCWARSLAVAHLSHSLRTARTSNGY